MIQAEIKDTIKFPSEIISKQDLMTIARTIIIPALVSGIDNQQSIDGGPFPPLEEETIAKKTGQNIKLYAKKTRLIKRAQKIEADIYSGWTGYAERKKASLLPMGFYKTLIDTGRLRRSFNAIFKGKYSVLIHLIGDRAEIGKYLQVDGVGKKRKQFRFFGLTDGMNFDAMDFIKARVKSVADKFNGR